MVVIAVRSRSKSSILNMRVPTFPSFNNCRCCFAYFQHPCWSDPRRRALGDSAGYGLPAVDAFPAQLERALKAKGFQRMLGRRPLRTHALDRDVNANAIAEPIGVARRRRSPEGEHVAPGRKSCMSSSAPATNVIAAANRRWSGWAIAKATPAKPNASTCSAI
jgi:hypothetical protein